ncbi:MAG: hypothetical protein Q4D06_06860 [Coriobacteriia bacterium]|nr:hypothetical protein [Coriobacteriia bacterium]
MKKTETQELRVKRVLSRAMAVATASVLAASLAAAPAMAAGIEDVVGKDAQSPEGLVTAAAARAAMPMPEILGVTNVEDNGDSFSQVSSWSSPKYLLMGTNYNSKPNPYMYNSAINAVAVNAGGTATATPSMVINSGRNGDSAVGKGPGQPLADYGQDQSDDAVWDQLPDIVIGSSDPDYYASSAAAISQAKGVEYNPVSMAYTSSLLNDKLESVYNMATIADNIVATTGKKLRYDKTATQIAQDFEKYAKGTRGYIRAMIADGVVKQKTIASIKGYDEALGVFSLNKTSENGSASTNRYIEAVQTVSTNLGDTKETVTLDELKDVDLILFGGTSNTITATQLTELLGAQASKFYYVGEGGSGSNGSMYGTVMNSVENVQNFGRILGCLYPEIVDQSDLVAYYYSNFYHIASGKLGEVIDQAMDGVVNWNNIKSSSDRTNWTAEDVADYNEADVAVDIDFGTHYLMTLSVEEQGLDAFTVNPQTGKTYVEDPGEVEPAKPIAEPQTISVTKSTWSKTYGNGSFSLGAKAKTALTYKSSNTKVVTVGSTGRVYIKGAGTAKITISAKATDQYKAATKTVTIKVAKKAQSLTVSTAKKTAAKGKYTSAVSVKGAKGAKSFKKVSGSKYLTVTKTGKIKVSAKAKRGATYSVKVKVSAKETANYKAGSKTATIKVKVK